jgi:hypothetical protein
MGTRTGRVDTGASHSRPSDTAHWNDGPRYLPGSWGRLMTRRSSYPEVFGGLFPAISHDFEAYLRTLIEAAQSRLFYSRNVNEHVLAASVGLNKSIALRRVEPLHRTYSHVRFP